MMAPMIARLLPLLLLAACATTATAPPVVSVPDSPLPPGLARLQGMGEAQVLALLGPASMARDEGPARQLQFIRPPCVLDVFLYPQAGGGLPRVRTATARRPDGSRMDSGVCLALITPA
jgi:hypothetical protein